MGGAAEEGVCQGGRVAVVGAVAGLDAVKIVSWTENVMRVDEADWGDLGVLRLLPMPPLQVAVVAIRSSRRSGARHRRFLAGKVAAFSNCFVVAA